MRLSWSPRAFSILYCFGYAGRVSAERTSKLRVQGGGWGGRAEGSVALRRRPSDRIPGHVSSEPSRSVVFMID